MCMCCKTDMHLLVYEVLKTSSMRFNALPNTSHHGLLHPFKHVPVVMNNLTAIRNEMPECLFVVNRS
jgi:hypothetical protein